jgi:Flp pilus assembly protein TadB
VRRLIDDWPEISDDLIALPRIVHSFVREHEKRRMRPVPTDRHRLRQQARAARRAFAGAVFMLGGVLWLGFDLFPSAVGIAAAALGGLVVLWSALSG